MMTRKMRIELSRERKVLIITLVISLFLTIFGILSNDVGVLGNVIIIAVVLIAVPQLIFNYINFTRSREMELRFPNFLRDLVEMTRAGLPLHKAIIFASKTDYGVLSKEVNKMASQLSWNVNLMSVLEQAKGRMKSKQMSRVFRIIIETYKAGGTIDETLNSLSDSLSVIHETEKDRKSMLNQYVVAMYVITLVFIGIVIGINKLMVPIFKSLTPTTGAPMGELIVNPCEICLASQNIQCSPCRLYFGLCSIFKIDNISISCYYFSLFFFMSTIQAITGGLVAGQIGEDSVRAGIKHSLIMLGIAFGAFFILVKLKLIGV